MEDVYTFLLRYFKTEMAEGKTEFRLVASPNNTEGVHLYIHPFGKDGKSVDLDLSVHTYKQVSLSPSNGANHG